MSEERRADWIKEKVIRMENLQIERMVLGQVSTNCYLAVNKETKEVILIDPADEARRIDRKVKESGLKPVAILLTHGHFDHIGAAKELSNLYDIMIYAHEAEEEVMTDSMVNLSANFGEPFKAEPDMLLTDRQGLLIADMKIQVLHTPGHTKGSVCYYLPEERVLFSGDTLFQGSIGRTDFPTGSMSQLVRAAEEKLFVLPEDVKVYPGHGEETTIRYEKRYNPFLR